jgi:DNA-directed RNA polymerase specialized sigma24 family protein
LTDVSSAADLAATAADGDPREGLRAVVALRQLLERLERLHVLRAREQGWSWQDIASVLGVSRQAVHQKYGAADRVGTGRTTDTSERN